MKKLIVMMLLAITAVCGYAHELEHRTMQVSDSTLTLPVAWDRVMRWVVANEDDYGLRIAYENPTTGSLIVKGEYRDKNNALRCVYNDLIKPIASFTIEVNCKDGKVFAEMTEALYEYKVGYGSVYSLSTYQLKWCKQEMEEIESIMRHMGEKVNCYDSYFEETYNDYSNKEKEAKAIEKDENLPKKERKKAKKYLEENEWRNSPYLYIHGMPAFTARDLFDGNKGLRKYLSK